MFKTPNSIIKSWFSSSENYLTAQDVMKARTYITKYWQKLERYHPKDDETLLGLPKPYLVPAYEAGHNFDFNEMYYWDSYFMVQGLLKPKHKDLVEGILQNLIYMQKRFGVIPNASRTYLMGRSQPPLLTSFIFDIFKVYNKNTKWLKQNMEIAEVEYRTVWMGTKKPNERQVYAGLSRYYDINYINDLAEAESGWDMTTRFDHKALDYLPIDLNSLLYKYEQDFANSAKSSGDFKVVSGWQNKAQIRKNTINSLMWNEMRGFYFDYDFKRQKRGSVWSLAGFYPMWAGLADESKVAKMVKNLSRFEHSGGLSTTDTQTLPISNLTTRAIPTQWAYPNGWAPLHFMVIKGLERYGYHKEAKRITNKWLKTNLNWFNSQGIFLEKYNVVNPNRPPVKGLYPSQIGFGWTNAIFERLCQDYIDA